MDTKVLMGERKVLYDFCHKFSSKTISEGSLSFSNTLGWIVNGEEIGMRLI